MKRSMFLTLLTLLLFQTSVNIWATKLIDLKVIDKNYLMVHFRDGEVHYRDDATGPSAYLGHTFVEGDDTLMVFGQRLQAELAQQANQWRIRSTDDKAFGNIQPTHVWRKSKPMNFDHTLVAELDHWLFLELPKPMRQGNTYEVVIPTGIGADKSTASVKFDVWNTPSEALHVNIIGYSPAESVHPADLYLWLGGTDSIQWHRNLVAQQWR